MQEHIKSLSRQTIIIVAPTSIELTVYQVGRANMAMLLSFFTNIATLYSSTAVS